MRKSFAIGGSKKAAAILKIELAEKSSAWHGLFADVVLPLQPKTALRPPLLKAY